MGSGFGGERQGQEIATANTAGMQSATSLEPAAEPVVEVIPLCNRSGARVQCKEFMERITRASGFG